MTLLLRVVSRLTWSHNRHLEAHLQPLRCISFRPRERGQVPERVASLRHHQASPEIMGMLRMAAIPETCFVPPRSIPVDAGIVG